MCWLRLLIFFSNDVKKQLHLHLFHLHLHLHIHPHLPLRPRLHLYLHRHLNLHLHLHLQVQLHVHLQHRLLILIFILIFIFVFNTLSSWSSSSSLSSSSSWSSSCSSSSSPSSWWIRGCRWFTRCRVYVFALLLKMVDVIREWQILWCEFVGWLTDPHFRQVSVVDCWKKPPGPSHTKLLKRPVVCFAVLPVDFRVLHLWRLFRSVQSAPK